MHVRLGRRPIEFASLLLNINRHILLVTILNLDNTRSRERSSSNRSTLTTILLLESVAKSLIGGILHHLISHGRLEDDLRLSTSQIAIIVKALDVVDGVNSRGTGVAAEGGKEILCGCLKTSALGLVEL